MCTRGHVFFTEMKSFDPGFGSPKMENVSSYIMFLLLSNFQLIRKGWYTEKKKNHHQMFFPMFFKRIWMLSRLCCCIVVFTLHMYASSMGIYACAKNANVGAFHFVHMMLDRCFHLLEHCQYHGRDHVGF